MTGKFNHFFPVTTYSVKAGLTAEQRQAMIDHTDACVMETGYDTTDTSWTGDFFGHHRVHDLEQYAPIVSVLHTAFNNFIVGLGVTPDIYDFWITRSWPVKQVDQKSVAFHRHQMAHLVAVYYPKAPEGSGKFQIATEAHQNELFPGMFDEAQYNKGIISSSSAYTSSRIDLSVEDDLLFIFPAKLAHQTLSNAEGVARYSVTFDAVMSLKDPTNLEMGHPPVDQWRKLDRVKF
jgi:hypothetical protein